MGKSWTPEEDEILYRYGSQMPLPRLAKLLQKKTGVPRSEPAIAERRRRIDPLWATDPVGFISFHQVTGHGKMNTAVNVGAMQQAIADGVLKRRWVGGYKRVLVPVEWADRWIEERAKAQEEYDRLRAEGWMRTSEIADALGKDRKILGICLSRRTHLNGMYQVFRDVPKAVAPDGSHIWEGTKMRAAIAAWKRMKRSIAAPTGWWGLNRTGKALGIGHKSLKPPTQWLLELGFDKLSTKTNEVGHLYWKPDEIIAFRRQHDAEFQARKRPFTSATMRRRAAQCPKKREGGTP